MAVIVFTQILEDSVVTVTGSYPIPRIDDSIDRIGPPKFVSKPDLLKGYWQASLTEHAKRLSAFLTPQGLYQYKAMLFGMKNARAIFQRLINYLLQPLDGYEGYIDDVSCTATSEKNTHHDFTLSLVH